MEALHAAITQANLESIAELVEQYPALLQDQDDNGRTPIFTLPSLLSDEAAVTAMDLFVQAGAVINHQDSNGRTVSFEVCAKGLQKCLDFILTQDKGAMHHRDRLGQTPLYSAVRNYQVNLIRKMAIPVEILNRCDEMGQQTLLFYAAACNHDDICMVLLKKGADPLIKDYCGQTILAYTSKTPRFQAEVRRLIIAHKQQKEQEEAREYELGEQKERLDLLNRKQAYQVRILRGVRTQRASKAERVKLLEDFQRMKQKAQDEAYLYDPEFDDQHEQENNWRNIAIKIVRTCASSAAGRWFVHTNNSARAMLLVVNKTTKAIRAEARKWKTLQKKIQKRREKLEERNKKSQEKKKGKSQGKPQGKSQGKNTKEVKDEWKPKAGRIAGERPKSSKLEAERQRSGRIETQRPKSGRTEKQERSKSSKTDKESSKSGKKEKTASGKEQNAVWCGRDGWKGRKPMGMSLILEKLEHHVYRNAHEFVRDMELIWVNAHQVYGPRQRITLYVHQLRQHFYDLLARYDYIDTFSH